MELKDHLTSSIDLFTAFYLEQAKTSENINESLNYVNEAQKRIKAKSKSQDKQTETKAI